MMCTRIMVYFYRLWFYDDAIFILVRNNFSNSKTIPKSDLRTQVTPPTTIWNSMRSAQDRGYLKGNGARAILDWKPETV